MDANVVIAALMRDAGTRRLLVLGGYEIHAPEYFVGEIEAHAEELSQRAGLSIAPGTTIMPSDGS